jgi:MFS family permease
MEEAKQSAAHRRTIIALLLSLSTTLAWWGISSWLPPFAASLAAKSNLPRQQWAAYAGMAYNFGGVLGYVCLGFLADWIGRRPTAMLYFVMAFLMTPVLYLWTQDLNLLLLAAGINGFFTLGQFSWMPVWLPELFPTRLRGTGIAFVFNVPRFIAFLGPLFAGTLIVQFGGFGKAAMIFACIYFLGFVAADNNSMDKSQSQPRHYFLKSRRRNPKRLPATIKRRGASNAQSSTGRRLETSPRVAPLGKRPLATIGQRYQCCRSLEAIAIGAKLRST